PGLCIGPPATTTPRACKTQLGGSEGVRGGAALRCEARKASRAGTARALRWRLGPSGVIATAGTTLPEFTAGQEAGIGSAAMNLVVLNAGSGSQKLSLYSLPDLGGLEEVADADWKAGFSMTAPDRPEGRLLFKIFQGSD